MADKKSKLRREVVGWAKVAAAVLLIRFFVVQPFMIPSESMANTLLHGDFLFASKFTYGLKVPWTSRWLWQFKKVQRGDVVIFHHPPGRKDLIKRCIAVEGDVVEIKDKQVYVNGEPLVETYAMHSDHRCFAGLQYKGDYQRAWERGEFSGSPWLRDNFGPVTVPRGHLFMLGDNRDNSADSRFWGPLDADMVKAKAMILWFSYVPPWHGLFRDLVKNVRWGRIGDLIT
jgi:signal peptidase I